MEERSKTIVDTLNALKAGELDVDEAMIKLAKEIPNAGDGESDRYEIISEEGRGGVGVVYLVKDKRLDREVALKRLRPEHTTPSHSRNADSSQHAARFLREAIVTGQLEHPNIVPVYEIAKDEGDIYYTMKFIRGQSLGDCLKEVELSDAYSESEKAEKRLEFLNAFVDICNAVAFAHNKRIIHRDLKPDNIMLGDFGETLLVDWGLAAYLDEELVEHISVTKIVDADDKGVIDSRLTQQGSVLGTPAYMAPEQARGDLAFVNQKSDIFALGAILHEILSGQPPIAGDTLMQVLTNAGRGNYRDLRKTAPEAPPELVAIAEYGMSKEPDDRPSSAAELAEAVEAWRDGGRVNVYQYSSWELLKRFAKRNRAVLTSAAVALVALVAVLLWAFVNVQNEANRAQEFLEVAQGRLTELGVSQQETILQKEKAEENLALAKASEGEAKRLLEQSNKLTAQVFHAESERLNSAGKFSEAALFEVSRVEYDEGVDWQNHIGNHLEVLPLAWDARDRQAPVGNCIAVDLELGLVVRSSTSGFEIASLIDGQTIQFGEIQGENVCGAVFHPKEPVLALSTTSGGIYLWDLVKKEVKQAFGDTTAAATGLYFLADGNALFATTLKPNWSSTLFEYPSGNVVSLPKGGSSRTREFPSPDAESLIRFTRESRSRKLRVERFDIASQELRDSIEIENLSARLGSFWHSKNAQWWVLKDDFGRTMVWDFQNWQVALDKKLGEGPAIASSVSEDGKLLFIRKSADAPLEVYECASGELVSSVPLGHYRSNREFVSRDSRFLYSSGAGKYPTIVDAESGKVLMASEEYRSFNLDLALSGDGQILMQPNQMMVKARASATGDEFQNGENPVYPAHGGVFDPTDRQVAIATSEGVRVYDSLSGEARSETLSVARSQPESFSPCGRFLLVRRSDRGREVWELATNSIVASYLARPMELTNSAVFASDSSVLAIGQRNGKVTILPIGFEQSDIYHLPSQGRRSYPMSFLEEDRQLLVSYENGEVVLWNIITLEQIWRGMISEANGVRSDGRHTVGPNFALFSTKLRSLSLYRAGVKDPISVIELPEHAKLGLQLDAKARNLYAITESGEVLSWMLKDPQEAQSFGASHLEIEASFGVGGDEISLRHNAEEGLRSIRKGNEKESGLQGEFVGNSGRASSAIFIVQDPKFETRSTRSRGQQSPISIGAATGLRVRKSMNQKQLVLLSVAQSIVLVDLEQGQRSIRRKEALRRISPQRGYNGVFDLSYDLKLVASAAKNGSVQVWNLTDDKLVRLIPGSSGPVTRLGFRAHSRQLVTISRDDLLRVLDAETGEEVRRVFLPSGSSQNLLLSSDGSFAITSRTMGDISLWDLDSGREIRRLCGHSAEVVSLVLSADGKKLISESADKTTRVWDLSFQENSVVPEVMGNARVLKALIQRQLGRKLEGAKIVPLNLSRRSAWLNESQKAPVELHRALPTWADSTEPALVDNKFGMDLSESEVALIEAFDAERLRGRMRRSLEFAKAWESRYEGYRYLEKDGRREYLPARAKDPLSGGYLGEPQGIPDHTKWWQDDQARRELLRSGGHTFQDLLKLDDEKINFLEAKAGDASWNLALAQLSKDELADLFARSYLSEKAIDAVILALDAIRKAPTYSEFLAKLAQRRFVEAAWRLGLFDDE